jgi:CPA1 family monovalent cation:H+ antiporter
MSHFELVAVLLVLTATFSWVNFRLAFLPHTIGLLVMGLGASLVIIGAQAVMPGLFDYAGLAALLRQVDFQQTVLEGMLAFLLFAGALHVDVVGLRSRAVTIGTMATLGLWCLPRSSEPSSGRLQTFWVLRSHCLGRWFSAH